MENEYRVEKILQKFHPYAFYGDLKNKKDFIFVIDLEELKIVGINNDAKVFFDSRIHENEEDSRLFERIFAPGSYCEFTEHLKTFHGTSKNKETEIMVSLKKPYGKSKPFLFKNRFYFGNPSLNKPYIISFAQEIGKVPKQGKMKLPRASMPNIQYNKYREILQSIKDGFCSIELIFDLAGNPIDYLILETNAAFESQLKLLDPVGKTIRELEPNKEEHWLENYARAARTGTPFYFDNNNKNQDQCWHQISALPLRNKESGKLAVLFSDRTGHKLFEQKLNHLNNSMGEKILARTKKLKKNAEFLQTVFDTTHVGIVIFKPVYNKDKQLIDFQYDRVNQVVTDQYGRNDLIGSFFTEINLHEPDMGIFEVLKRTFLTGEGEDVEVFYDRDGYNNWFRVITTKQDGFLITSLEDISLRKRESEKLKESVRFIKQLAKTTPDVIMIFNLYQENIRFINRDLARKAGMKRRDILGMNLLDILPFIHPLERERAMDFHQKIINASEYEIIEIEFRLKGKNQPWEWFNARGKVFMRNKRNKVYEYIIMLRNIQDQKKTQKALLDAEKLSIKGEVARTLAHELRNPLASIGMATDILLGSNANAENAAEIRNNYIEIIKRSTKVLNKLVTDLLTSSNYTEAVFKKVCLSRVLEDALTLAGDRIYLAGIKVIKNYKKGYFISADVEKLKIALLNLIVNASEAMEPDEGILTLGIQKERDKVLLNVEDNGCGLNEEQQEKLFDSFYTQKSHGLGIGLSSVKTILEEHGAQIEVTSQLNIGTTFYISFHNK